MQEGLGPPSIWLIHDVFSVLAVKLVLVVGEEDVGDHSGAADGDDPEQHDVGLAVTEEVVLTPGPRIILVIKVLEVHIILEILLILIRVSVLKRVIIKASTFEK